MNKIYVQNCDPCYRCGNFAHYFVIWGKEKQQTLLCSNCLLYVVDPSVNWSLEYIDIHPIPYATYNPWLYEDYWKDDPVKKQMFRNTMIVNGFEEVDKYIWKKRATYVQGDTHTQEG